MEPYKLFDHINKNNLSFLLDFFGSLLEKLLAGEKNYFFKVQSTQHFWSIEVLDETFGLL